MDHYDPRTDIDDNPFYQPGNLWRLLTEDKKALLISNTAADIASVTENIKYRHAAHCYLADVQYGTRIAEALKLNLARVVELSGMTHAELCAATM